MWEKFINIIMPAEVASDEEFGFDWRHTDKPQANVRRVQIEEARLELVAEGNPSPSMAKIIDRFQQNTGRVSP